MKVKSMILCTFLSKSVHYNRPLRDPMVRSKALWAHKCEGLLLIYSHTLGSRPSLNYTNLLETSKTQSLKIKSTSLKRLHLQQWSALTSSSTARICSSSHFTIERKAFFLRWNFYLRSINHVMFPNNLQIGVSLSLHKWQYHINMISYKDLAIIKMREDEKMDK